MQQMDKEMVRGAKFALNAGVKDLACTVLTRSGNREAFIVSADYGQLLLDHNGKTAIVNAAYVQVEDEVAETLRAYYERGTENLRHAREFGVQAMGEGRTGSYSAGRQGYRAR